MSDDNTSTPSPIGEIAHGPSASEQFLEKNQKLILVIVIAVVLALISWTIVKGMKQDAQEDAGQALLNASSVEEFRSVITDHTGSAAAGSAHLGLSKALWAEDKRNEAIETLNSFLSQYPEHPARPSAQARLGSFLIQEEQIEAAKTALQAALDEPDSDFIAHYVLITLGDLAREEKDIEAARSYYSNAANQSSVSVEGTNAAKERLALLDIEPASLVAPPAPPVVDPTLDPTPKVPGLPTPPAGATPPVVVPAIPTPVEPTPGITPPSAPNPVKP